MSEPLARDKTLIERVEDLEIHQKEIDQRVGDLFDRLIHQRNRIDRVLGSEPSEEEREDVKLNAYRS